MVYRPVQRLECRESAGNGAKRAEKEKIRTPPRPDSLCAGYGMIG